MPPMEPQQHPPVQHPQPVAGSQELPGAQVPVQPVEPQPPQQVPVPAGSGAHTPPWQVPAPVARVQVVPSATAGVEQAPEAGSQVPSAWHWSWAWQTSGAPATQVPAAQWSREVHPS